jgi:hypothetical protein
MKYEFVSLCHIIPSPDHPGSKLNVMLKPLIDELEELWKGFEAHDCHEKQEFTLFLAKQQGRPLLTLFNILKNNIYRSKTPSPKGKIKYI